MYASHLQNVNVIAEDKRQQEQFLDTTRRKARRRDPTVSE